MDIDKLKRMATDPAFFEAEVVIPSASGQCRFRDVMAPYQKDRFEKLNPALVAIGRGEKPDIGRHWWEATKGASKDSDLAVALLWLLAFSHRPLACQVGAADAEQAGELRKALELLVNLNPWIQSRVKVTSSKISCAATHSTCEIIAADVAGSHGARPDVLIINELSHITKQEFAENLRDNAAKVPHGLVVIATNAGNVESWQWKWRTIARESDRWYFHRLAEPAPWLDKDEIEEAKRRNSPSRFRRLWMGVWSTGGDAIDPEDIEACTTADGPIESYLPAFAPYFASLDLGLKHDHACLMVLGLDALNQKIRLAQCVSWTPEMYAGKIQLGDVRATAIDLHRRFNFACMIYDPWQAELMAEDLERHGVNTVPMTFSSKNLDVMATRILQAFRNRQLVLYPDEGLIRDLNRLAIVERPSGHRLQATKDENGHADRATSLAMAIPHGLQGLRQVLNHMHNPKAEPEYVFA